MFFRKTRKIITFIILGILAASLFISTAYGSLDVTIQLTDSCIELNKAHTYTCPRYTQWYELDNSIPIVSGPLIWNGQDIYREYNGKHSTYRYYDIIQEQIIFLDPPPLTAKDRVIQLYITPNVSWHDKNYTYQYLYIHHCQYADIAPELAYYPNFMKYLIEYMSNGCGEKPHLHTAYQAPRDVPSYVFDWKDSPAIKAQLWLENAKKECKKKC